MTKTKKFSDPDSHFSCTFFFVIKRVVEFHGVLSKIQWSLISQWTELKGFFKRYFVGRFDAEQWKIGQILDEIGLNQKLVS